MALVGYCVAAMIYEGIDLMRLNRAIWYGVAAVVLVGVWTYFRYHVDHDC